MNSASLRRDKQLQELIDCHNFKQALTLCEKSLKKGDKSEELLITKINILLAHPDRARQQQGRKELDEILGRSPPISEIEALCALNNLTQSLGENDPRIETLWERAAGVRPHDEDLYIKWFKTKFAEGKWKAAQKAAMMYMKRFPEKREPFYWNILTCELAGTHQSSSEIDRKILRPLAYGFLSKASSDVAADKPVSSSVRALSSLEDLFLLLDVYRSQERYAEALKVVDDPRTGIKSRLGNNSWELVRHKIELYELCHLWNEEWQFCRELLEDAHPDNLQNTSRSSHHQFGTFGDDWKVWVGLLTAHSNINTSENSNLTEELILLYIKPKTISRNARLALLRYHSAGSPEPEPTQEKLLLACVEYFLKYRSKVICFPDLQPYISKLEKPLREQFLGLVAQATRGSMSKSLECITSEINVLKFDYFLLVSRTDTPDQINLLQAFVSRCLQLYKVSLSVVISLPVSDRRPGDDAAILAAMGLVRLHEFAEKHAVLHCIAILELLVSNSKHNYDALLTLVRLYMRLGAGSLAIEHHSRLSIKNLQHATISWILYTRISTIHPYASSRTNSVHTPIDMSKSLSIAIDWHKSAEELGSVSIDRMLDNGQYSMLVDTLEVDKCIKNSFGKYMFVVESHRIGRLSQFAAIKDYSNLLDRLPFKTEDTRDVKAFPDIEATGEKKFEEYLQTGPRPNHIWLGSQTRMIELSKFLQTKRGNFEKSPGTLMTESNKSETDSLTGIERQTHEIVDTLRALCVIYHTKPKRTPRVEEDPGEGVCSILQDLQEWQSRIAKVWKDTCTVQKNFPLSSVTETQDLNWEYFHKIFVLFDLFRLIIQTLDYALAENRNYAALDQRRLDEISKQIRKSITELWANMHEATSAVRDRLRAPGAAAEVVEVAFAESKTGNGIGLELRALIGVPKLEEIVSDLCSSWTDGLDGILRTKMA